MTSNLGSQIIQESIDLANVEGELPDMNKLKIHLMDLLRQTIRPEFLNRIDETVVFKPLTRDAITEIVKMQFAQVLKRLSGTDIKIEITDAAVNWLANIGYEPHFGARPVKRILQRYVLNELSKKILGGTVDKTKPIIIDEIAGELIFRN